MTTRHLPFERGVNFRDLGGYETADGARVKWRRLFRCGALDRLTDADLARLEELRLASVCDFRADEECVRQPSRLPDSLRDSVRRLEIIPGGNFTAQEGILHLVTHKHTAAELAKDMREIYLTIALDHAPIYADMFRHLIAAEGRAMLIHCTGGKDRTGIGAALILSALGVPEETIVNDYMLSADSVPMRIWLNSLVDFAAKQHPLPKPRDELLKDIVGIWGVNHDWLHTALRAMDEAAGSVEGYIREVLDVSEAELKRLRGWYLEA